MKKSKTISAIVLLVMCAVGIIYVGAASSTIYTNSSYSISAGLEKTVSDLTAPYGYARASMGVDSLTGSGTRSTKFIVYKKTGSAYAIAKTATKANMVAQQSTSVSIGYVGSGTWKITNSAVGFGGWKGTLAYVSQSS